MYATKEDCEFVKSAFLNQRTYNNLFKDVHRFKSCVDSVDPLRLWKLARLGMFNMIKNKCRTFTVDDMHTIFIGACQGHHESDLSGISAIIKLVMSWVNGETGDHTPPKPNKRTVDNLIHAGILSACEGYRKCINSEECVHRVIFTELTKYQRKYIHSSEPDTHDMIFVACQNLHLGIIGALIKNKRYNIWGAYGACFAKDYTAGLTLFKQMLLVSGPISKKQIRDWTDKFKESKNKKIIDFIDSNGIERLIIGPVPGVHAVHTHQKSESNDVSQGIMIAVD